MVGMRIRRFFPRFPLLLLRKAIVVILLISSSFTIGYYVGFSGFKSAVSEFPKVEISRETPPEKQNLDFSLFWRVWDTLHTRYFDKEKLIPSQLVYGAIRGMVASIDDPYTVFLPPSENKIVQEDLQGNFEGVGIQIGFKGTQLAVIAPLPNSPAEKAGVRAGDFIVGIIDKGKEIERNTSGITLPEAVQAIRGPAGSRVTLVLRREEKEELLEIEIVRASINVSSIIVDYLGEDSDESGKGVIAHVKVLKFAGETLTEWEETVIELLKRKDLSGIIIDVRNNPGGFLQGAVELASDFLDTGEVVVTEEDGSGLTQEFRVEKLGRFRNSDIVVLVNEGSASASEIFAGALRDNKEVILVGETTFGKGTIQESQQIDNGIGLHITTARWLTPSGFWVNDGGLIPDIEIEDNPETEEDEQLLEAVKLFE
jgi:carboxyl-terminal processing protease